MAQCEHMRSVPVPEPEASGIGCKECLEIGQEWIQLRKCLDCGHIGCCDSSIGKHATKHRNETGHQVIRTFQPGDDWVYCYEDGEMA